MSDDSFGLRLLKRSLASDVGGDVTIDAEPQRLTIAIHGGPTSDASSADHDPEQRH